MRSIFGSTRLDSVFDQLEAEVRRCSDLPFEEMTAPELWAALERYEMLRATFATVRYQLTNPFARNAEAEQSA
jgi:hypothetical protein